MPMHGGDGAERMCGAWEGGRISISSAGEGEGGCRRVRRLL